MVVVTQADRTRDVPAPSRPRSIETVGSGASPLPDRPLPSLVGRELAFERVRNAVLGEKTPVVIGRFMVIRRLGQGAMGVVYAAYDPKLDRKVAIKLVAGGVAGSEGEARQARLEREARLVATLSHPNVVVVYDVGLHDGAVYLAMEMVEGTTLGAWLSERARPWRDVVRRIADAGRGLAAAHAIGLVHRDFKPDNVLVGKDGRVRVADFGLAKPVHAATRDGATSAAAGGADQSAAEDATTGELAGTPAYMAPEQFIGVDVGPHSDQFALCVSLFEGLFGGRPFIGRSLTELATAVMQGEIRALPPRHGVPDSIVRVVMRGLSTDKTRRFPSVEALVDALERAAGGGRRRRIAMAAAVATVGALVGGYALAGVTRDAPCEDPQAALGGAWDADRRALVTAALGDASNTIAAIDRHANAWSEHHVEVCEATRVRGEQSELTMSLRMACLGRMRGRLDALTSELAAAEAIDTDAARGIEGLLAPLDVCDDVESLAALSNALSTTSKRADAEADRAWHEGEAMVARAETRLLLGEAGAGELAEGAARLAEAHALHDLHARALLATAEVQRNAGDLDAARQSADRATGLAITAGEDEPAARLMLTRAELATNAGALAEARLHLGYFDAFVGRVAGDRGDRLVTAAHATRGTLALAEGLPEVAQRHLEQAIAATDDPTQALALRQNLALAQYEQGRLQDALASWHAIVPELESMPGTALELAGTLGNVGRTLRRLDRFEDSRAAIERGLAIARGAIDDVHPLAAMLLSNLAAVERAQGRLDLAESTGQRALAIRRETLGPQHPAVASSLEGLATISLERGRLDDALAAIEEAGEIRSNAQGPTHPDLAETIALFAKVKIASGDVEVAVSSLRNAMTLREGRDDLDPELAATVIAALARALPAADRGEAETLARRAIADYARAGVHTADDRATLQAWLER